MKYTYRPEDIEVITTVRFATPDGEIHDTLAAALAHSIPRSVTYKMWRADGGEGIVPVTDFESCVFLFLPDAKSVLDFEDGMRECDYTLEGIEGPGWYFWNEDLLEWEVMRRDIQTILEYLYRD